MNNRWFRLLSFVGIVSFALSASNSGGQSKTLTRVPESTLYVYLNQNNGWCALRSRTTFMAEVNSDKASQFEADQAQIWFRGTTIKRLTEFRMDAEGEWSTTSTYNLDESGNVISVNVVARSGETATDKTFNFIVTKGIYSPKIPSALSPETFRKAISYSSFPFLDLSKKLAGDKTAKKLCS